MSTIQPPPSPSYNEAVRSLGIACEQIGQNLIEKAIHIHAVINVSLDPTPSAGHLYVSTWINEITRLETLLITQINEAHQLLTRIMEVLPANHHLLAQLRIPPVPSSAA